MSFEKKEWKYKDTITAEDLNRMEDGIEEALENSEGASYEETCVEIPYPSDVYTYTFDVIEYHISSALLTPGRNSDVVLTLSSFETVKLTDFIALLDWNTAANGDNAISVTTIQLDPNDSTRSRLIVDVFNHADAEIQFGMTVRYLRIRSAKGRSTTYRLVKGNGSCGTPK